MYNSNDPLKIAKDALDKAIETEKRNRKLLESIGPAIIQALSPLFTQLQGAISRLKVDVNPIVQVNPEIRIPPITVPTPQYTPPDVIVNYTPPKIDVPMSKIDLSSLKIPELRWPKGEMPITGKVSLSNIDINNPLPVQLRDAKGNPVTLGAGGVIMGGGGGPSGGVIINDTAHPVPVSIVSGSSATSAVNIVDSSGIPFDGSNPLPITGSISTTPGATFFASDAVLSVNIIQNLGNGTPVGGGYQDNALRVVQATDAVVSVNIVGENQTLEVIQLSGGVNSVNIVGNIATLDVQLVSGSVASISIASQPTTLDVKQVSGSVDSVSIAGNIATLDVQLVSGSVASTNLLQTAGNPTVVGTGYQDNALRVVNATDAVVSVNIMADGVHLDVQQVSGATDSVNIVSSVALVVTSITNSVAAALVDSSGIEYSGSNPLPVNLVSQSLASSASVLVDSTGVAYEGANPLPITIVTNQTASVNVAVVDSGGVAYDGVNPLPVTIISGALTSTLAVGDSAARSADNGGNPVKVGGIARQTNPTAFSDGDRSNFGTDDLGRQLVRPVQVRDLTVTAYASFATGTEATLLAGTAGKYNDLIYILASNNSTVAVGIDIRPSTAGSIVMHLEIPANAVVGVSAPVPIPQQATGDGTGGTWTVDLPDITGTTVYVSGLFSQEV